ncbi:MAG: Fimbrial chaperone [Candidatus Tokpelaia hoelldobleri]|uniref:Fimbrial chaperone n=1 Tax=Candidatus Tokpelaia hoelldobleri TaxID=1902579 RepID=A0A1U9JVM1_9HYPH|nr:MAG: Fimbrial chaperone [Candidatus Tokpelaia hoelldoblerii]
MLFVCLKSVRLLLGAAVAAALLVCTQAWAQEAGTLRVTPVRINVQAPSAGAAVSLTNTGKRPMSVQVRVFKWTQKDGEEFYTPAHGVAVSPPMLTLKPRSTSVMRILRTDRAAIKGEESYRLVIDQLPDSALRRHKGSAVSFVVRHNLPVFFTAVGQHMPQVTWQAVPVKGGYKVVATNTGSSHMGFASVRLLAGKTVVGQLDGLAGYALAGSKNSFFVPAHGGGRPTRITAVDMNNTPVDDIIR